MTSRTSSTNWKHAFTETYRWSIKRNRGMMALFATLLFFNVSGRGVIWFGKCEYPYGFHDVGSLSNIGTICKRVWGHREIYHVINGFQPMRPVYAFVCRSAVPLYAQ